MVGLNSFEGSVIQGPRSISTSSRFDAGESDDTTGTTTTTTTSTTRTTGTTGQTTGTRRGSNQTTCTDDGTTTTTTTNATQTVCRVKAVDGVATGNFDLTQWENTRFEEDAQEMAGMKMNPKQEEKGAVMANNTVTMKSSIQERKKISKKKFVATVLLNFVEYLAAYSSLSIYCVTNESKIDWWLNSFIIFNTSAVVISLLSSICFEATRLLIEKEAQGDEEPIPYKCEVFACAVTLLRCSLLMANLVLFIFGHNIHFSIYVLCAIAVLCSYAEVVMTVIRAKTKK